MYVQLYDVSLKHKHLQMKLVAILQLFLLMIKVTLLTTYLHTCACLILLSVLCFQAQKKEQSRFYSDLLERRRTEEEKSKAKLAMYSCQQSCSFVKGEYC